MAQAGPTSGNSGGESFWRKFWENFISVSDNSNPADSATGGKVNGASTDHPTIPGTTPTTIFSGLSGAGNWLSILLNPVVLIIIVVFVLVLKKKF